MRHFVTNVLVVLVSAAAAGADYDPLLILKATLDR